MYPALFISKSIFVMFSAWIFSKAAFIDLQQHTSKVIIVVFFKDLSFSGAFSGSRQVAMTFQPK